MSEALPICPFCGSSGDDLNVFDHHQSVNNQLITIEKVQCSGCGAEAPMGTWKAQTGFNQLHAIYAERQRQVSIGYDKDHDDSHNDGSLNVAAACYCLGSARFWPWDNDEPTFASKPEDLVRAGALILAELERLDRAEATT